MKIKQECQVYVNIDFGDYNKRKLVRFIKKQLRKPEYKLISGNKIIDSDIVFDMPDLIVLDIAVNAKCNLVPGWKGSRLEPPEPAYIEDYLTTDDFYYWAKSIFKDSDFSDVEIEIDDDSYIPSEDFLLKTISEDYYNEKY